MSSPLASARSQNIMLQPNNTVVVTGDLPFEARVTDCVTGVFTTPLPNLRFYTGTLRVGTTTSAITERCEHSVARLG